jgi:hypothetical protein
LRNNWGQVDAMELMSNWHFRMKKARDSSRVFLTLQNYLYFQKLGLNIDKPFGNIKLNEVIGNIVS